MNSRVELLDAALNSLTEHLAIIDESGVICYVNQAWIDFGVANECRTSPPEWLGVNYLHICDAAAHCGDEHGALVSDVIRHVMSTTIESAILDYPCHSPTEKRWFSVRVQRLRWNGSPHFLISHHNITSHTLSEQSLLKKESRLRGIVDDAIDGIITIDEHGLIESFNPSAERLFGYDATEVIGQNVKMLMPEPHRSVHDNYLARYRQTGQAKITGVGREVVGLHKDGSTFPVDLAISENHQSTRRCFTWIVRDMTEHKDAEAKSSNKSP